MTITPIDPSLDRKTITAMIVSTRYLREVRDIYADTLLTTDYARTIAKWCIRYFEKYSKAPNKHIQDIYDIEVANERLKGDTKEMVGKYLTTVSDQFDTEAANYSNVDFLLDETFKWFKRRDCEELRRNFEDALAVAGPEEAEEILRKRKSIERIGNAGYNPLLDDDALDCVFETPPEPLLFFPGALGQLMNHSMVRDTLLGIMAPAKLGKTFFLTELCIRGCIARRNVAMFELGDMSKPQINRRFYANLCAMPYLERYVGDAVVPMLDCWYSQGGKCPVDGGPNNMAIRGDGCYAIPTAPPDYTPCPMAEMCRECRHTVTRCTTNYPKLMERADADKARKSLARHMREAQLKFDNAPNNSYSVESVRDTLNKWKEREGFLPDVISIDYDNTMKKEKGARDARESFIEQWKGFRGLSQDFHALVAVNAQTDAGGLDEENVTLDNFSGSVEKYQHSNCMLMLHGMRKELRLGMCRASWAMGREEMYGIEDQVVMLRHLGIGRPLVSSFWKNSDYKPRLLVEENA